MPPGWHPPGRPPPAGPVAAVNSGMRICDNGDGRQHYGLGLCQRCYQRQRAAAQRPPRPAPGPCLDCPEAARWKGRCKRCYNRHNAAQQRLAKGPSPRERHHGCQVEGCDRPHKAKHYCKMHYNALCRANARSLRGPREAGGVFAQLWQDPDRRKALRQAQSEGAKRRWANRRAKLDDPS